MHTAAPWTYDGKGVNRADEYHSRLATLNGEYTKDDGALLAAAPDLYHALCDLMERIDDLDAYSCAFEHDAARAAIARAEGRNA